MKIQGDGLYLLVCVEFDPGNCKMSAHRAAGDQLGRTFSNWTKGWAIGVVPEENQIDLGEFTSNSASFIFTIVDQGDEEVDSGFEFFNNRS